MRQKRVRAGIGVLCWRESDGQARPDGGHADGQKLWHSGEPIVSRCAMRKIWVSSVGLQQNVGLRTHW